MASASREIRRKHRVKRTLSLVTRAYRQEVLDRVKVTSVLLAVLQQQGGDVDVTQATLNQTIKALGTLQYVVEKKHPDSNPFDGLFVVRLVITTEQSTDQATAQAFVPEAGVETVDESVKPITE